VVRGAAEAILLGAASAEEEPAVARTAAPRRTAASGLAGRAAASARATGTARERAVCAGRAERVVELAGSRIEDAAADRVEAIVHHAAVDAGGVAADRDRIGRRV